MAETPSAKTWRSEGGTVHDPAPTRPVLRSELQLETGAWPVAPAATWSPTAATAPNSADQDGSVVDDLAESRRKRTGDDTPAVGIHHLPKPRRIGEPSGNGEKDRGGDDRSDPPPASTRTGRHRK
ncbi:hypothetical protein [Nocardia cyriacigeorgica]|uniref:hypothetical protein n=1 Tax=Nocardia cyriacigeorgica TaxID=135487 RepID=UPI00245573CA|nr:hypothetical protein [Nocardia cyriacigeorgica]